MKLQDMDGYPRNLNLGELLTGDEHTKEELLAWCTDLLALEAEPWLACEDETEQAIALALVASMRPLMEMFVSNPVVAADPEISKLAFSTYMGHAGILGDLSKIAKKRDLPLP